MLEYLHQDIGIPYRNVAQDVIDLRPSLIRGESFMGELPDLYLRQFEGIQCGLDVIRNIGTFFGDFIGFDQVGLEHARQIIRISQHHNNKEQYQKRRKGSISSSQSKRHR